MFFGVEHGLISGCPELPRLTGFYVPKVPLSTASVAVRSAEPGLELH